MKKLILFLILGVLFTTSIAQVTVDAIIAVVGKEIILQSDLDKAMAERTRLYQSETDLEMIRCATLQELVFAKLMVHQADIDSIVITQDDVDNQINARVQVWLQSVGGDPKLIEQHFGKTMEQIKQDMKEPMYNVLISERITASITDGITITPSEVKAFFNKFDMDSMPIIPETFEFGHIVKSPPVSEKEVASIKTLLNEYRERVLKGEKFSMLARLYSDDPGSAPKGGVLGFVERGELYPEFEAVAFSLKPGEVSQIVQTKAGYHIIQMIERRGDAINVAHILLQPKPSEEEQVNAITFLDSIRTVLIQNPIDFSEAAKKYSDDLSKNNGGWVVNKYSGSFKFDKESLEPTVYAVLSRLKPGEYSSSIPFVNEDGIMGYRIIYLKTKTAQHKANLSEDYDIIKNAALEEKKQNAIDKWIVNKVKVTSIKISEKYKQCPFVIDWQIP
ncbi:MAG: peptidylprolyl isomerase [Bacteroidales bacterium]|jgi:peptidyl-prolyl cis-trans isomerase SurA|nr:peptidylprolyl isomerase [Bacteroidales bacterium]